MRAAMAQTRLRAQSRLGLRCTHMKSRGVAGGSNQEEEVRAYISYEHGLAHRMKNAHFNGFNVSYI